MKYRQMIYCNFINKMRLMVIDKDQSIVIEPIIVKPHDTDLITDNFGIFLS